ncbi:hypothetical protein [Urbifossiella limnaea]|uniref:TerB family tellurite resistance protein n=1 Tax=Urbifossiella limnaea TaxID=2528023 RepID=A0A517XL03_9BACT|nr:hypothetical protein [Urbifossiella limnaea]QDU18184.1 hypothetical protein ETAA1_00670 [Urbifossiella limnaea]
MADWKKLAKDLLLMDGYIERKETEIVRKAILADGVVSKAEAEFLIELRKEAPKAVAEFHQFVLDVVKKAVLADGEVSTAETAWLEKFITADGKVDDLEKQLLRDLKSSATKCCAEFEALVTKYC